MLIVAVHDVAQSTLQEVRWLLARLDDMGVAPRVLKVVPGEPGTTDELGDLVRAEAAAGSEIVLHGWEHRACGPMGGSALDRLRAMLFAGGTAELLTDDAAEVERRVAAGCAWLADAGVAVRGFCSPAWLAGPSVTDVLRRHGLDYMVTLRGLLILGTRRWITLPPEGCMGGGRVQEGLVQLGAAVLARPLSALLPSPAHRVFVHPQGARRSRACAAVLRRIEVLARSHRPARYGDLLP